LNRRRPEIDSQNAGERGDIAFENLRYKWSFFDITVIGAAQLPPRKRRVDDKFNHFGHRRSTKCRKTDKCKKNS
jgi:hypothetical protein